MIFNILEHTEVLYGLGQVIGEKGRRGGGGEGGEGGGGGEDRCFQSHLD